ncbi:hypothetical protein CASFOL_041485 [Castilleja foliolosa]|uniref:Uncharacterized protein n=1 Tax=Castilleja foliolosa TaxID=1961234 RepID=A0ABD3BBI4_9LAMI
MVKTVKKKTMREKGSKIDRYLAINFRGRFPQYYTAYNELIEVSAGVEFTSPQTHSIIHVPSPYEEVAIQAYLETWVG